MTNAVLPAPGKPGASHYGPERSFYIGPCPVEGDQHQEFELTLYALDVESVGEERDLVSLVSNC